MEILRNLLHVIGLKALDKFNPKSNGEGTKGSPRNKFESPNENKR